MVCGAWPQNVVDERVGKVYNPRVIRRFHLRHRLAVAISSQKLQKEPVAEIDLLIRLRLRPGHSNLLGMK